MTIRDALAEIKIKYRMGCGPIPDTLPEEEWTKVHLLWQWLCGLSSSNMKNQFGENWGWHPDLPEDIDAATELNVDQENEFIRRFQQL